MPPPINRPQSNLDLSSITEALKKGDEIAALKLRMYADFQSSEKPTPASWDFGSFAERVRSHVHKGEKLFEREETYVHDPLNSPWGDFHKAADLLLQDTRRAVEQLEALPEKFRENNPTALQRIFVNCKALLAQAKYDEVQKLTNLFSFTDAEREFLLAQGVYENKNSIFNIKNSLFPQQRQFDLAEAAAVIAPTAAQQQIRIRAYEMIVRELNTSLDLTELLLMRVGLPDELCKPIERDLIHMHVSESGPFDERRRSFERYGTGRSYASSLLESKRGELLSAVVNVAKLSESEVEDLGVRAWARQRINELGDRKTQDWARLIGYINAGKLATEAQADLSIYPHAEHGFLLCLGHNQVHLALKIVEQLNLFKDGVPAGVAAVIQNHAIRMLKEPDRWGSVQELRTSGLLQDQFWRDEEYQSKATEGFIEALKRSDRNLPAGAIEKLGLDLSRLQDEGSQRILLSAALARASSNRGTLSEELIPALRSGADRTRVANAVVEGELLGEVNASRIENVVRLHLGGHSPAQLAPDFSAAFNGVISRQTTWTDLTRCCSIARYFCEQKRREFIEAFQIWGISGEKGLAVLELCAVRELLERREQHGFDSTRKPEAIRFWIASGVPQSELNIAYGGALQTVITHGHPSIAPLRQALEVVPFAPDVLAAAVIARVRNYGVSGSSRDIPIGSPHEAENALCGWISHIKSKDPAFAFAPPEQKIADKIAVELLASDHCSYDPHSVASIFGLTAEARASKEAKATARVAIAGWLSVGDVHRAQAIFEIIPQTREELDSPGLIVAAEKCALKLAALGDGEKIARLRELLPIPDAFWESRDFQEKALSGLLGKINTTRDIVGGPATFQRETGLKLETCLTPAAQGRIISAILDGAENGAVGVADSIALFVASEKRDEIAFRVLGRYFDRGGPACSPETVAQFGGDSSLNKHPEWLPARVRELTNLLSFSTWTELSHFAADNPVFYKQWFEEKPIPLTRAHIVAAKQLHLALHEAAALVAAEINLVDVAKRRDFKELSSLLQKHVEGWKDAATIQTPLSHGAAVFGWERMFEFLDYRNQISRREVNRHDQLFLFDEILGLREKLGMTPDHFFNRILDQVRRDGAEYRTGRSYNQLNSVAVAFPADPKGVLASAADLSAHPAVAGLAAYFTSREGQCDTWTDLKNFSKLLRVLRRADVLPQLDALQAEGKKGLYSFLTTLAFEPDSNVDFDKLVQYWRDPQAFLDLGDAHSDARIHDALKPGAWTRVRNLDLKAAELTEALAEGRLDSLQRIRPYEMTLTLPYRCGMYPSVRQALNAALGSREDGRNPEAKKPGLLFHSVKHMLPQGITVQEYLGGRDVPLEIEERISESLLNPEIGLRADTVQLRIGIHPKSSASGVLAGNRTACCMSFGAGKNNLYMFHLGTALLTVELLGDGVDDRTLAQSLMRLDRPIGIPFPALRRSLTTPTGPDTTIAQAVGHEWGSALNADNCEPARNINEHHKALIEAAYKIFLREYTSKFGPELGLQEGSGVAIGKGYSTSMTHLGRVDNRFVTRSPLPYTDMHEEDAYQLPLTGPLPPFFARRLGIPSAEPRAASQRDGLSDLTFEDTFSVVALEERVYRQIGLSETILQIAPTLMAKDINNHLKDRPNLSLKVMEKGSLAAYLVAYHGKDADGREVIYLEDLAANPDFPGAAAKLIREFGRRYKQQYLDRGKPLPILAELRTDTTYPFVKDALPLFGRKVGADFTVHEKGEIGSGPAHRKVVEIEVQKGRTVTSALAAVTKGLDSFSF